MKLKYVIYLTGIKILILKYDIKQIRFSVMNIASNIIVMPCRFSPTFDTPYVLNGI